jgi:hypothetical protein
MTLIFEQVRMTKSRQTEIKVQCAAVQVAPKLSAQRCGEAAHLLSQRRSRGISYLSGAQRRASLISAAKPRISRAQRASSFIPNATDGEAET